ncbi:hypothetical protein PENSPDRAFT_655195 [Peniophora sp. CONT]|nr:hypothetical protein PENSPDRAFT_655195 [Peniophora sp. CONT]
MIRVALPDPVPVSDAIPVPYMPFNQAPDTASIPIGHAQTIHDAPLQNTATSLMNGSMGDTSHSDKASGTKPKTRGLMRRSRVQKPRDQSTTYTGSDGDSVAHTEPTEGGGIAREVSVADNNEPHVQGRSRESVKVESVVEAMALSADMHAPMVRQESSDSSVTVVERDDVGATSRYAKLDEESHLLRESIGLLGAYWQENSENIV